MSPRDFVEAVIDCGRTLYRCPDISVDCANVARGDLYLRALYVVTRPGPVAPVLDDELGHVIDGVWLDHCLDKPAAA